jgi:hypothetical protein
MPDQSRERNVRPRGPVHLAGQTPSVYAVDGTARTVMYTTVQTRASGRGQKLPSEPAKPLSSRTSDSEGRDPSGIAPWPDSGDLGAPRRPVYGDEVEAIFERQRFLAVPCSMSG